MVRSSSSDSSIKFIQELYFTLFSCIPPTSLHKGMDKNRSAKKQLILQQRKGKNFYTMILYASMYNSSMYIGSHSSEIRGLCLMKRPSKTLKNLPYTYTKTDICSFCFSFCATLFFPQ